MNAAAAERITLPPADEPGIRRLLEVVETPTDRPPLLVGPDGSEAPMPREVCEVLQQVVSLMAQGQAVTVAPHNLQLTTHEAAELLGVSRPALVRLLERGDIECSQPNRHGRVALADLLRYQAEAELSRRRALSSMVEISEGLDLYDESGTPLQR